MEGAETKMVQYTEIRNNLNEICKDNAKLPWFTNKVLAR